MALYDLKLCRKITEDFHPDVNHPLMKAIVQSIQANNDEPNVVCDIPSNWLAFPKQVQLFTFTLYFFRFLIFKCVRLFLI